MNVQRLRVPSQILLDVLFTEKHFDLSSYSNANIPADAKVVGMLAVPETLSVDLLLYSDKFPAVKEGSHVPFVNIALVGYALVPNEHERPEITRKPVT